MQAMGRDMKVACIFTLLQQDRWRYATEHR
jgi:hypothetical protein